MTLLGSLPSTCSGAMYAGVPMTPPISVMLGSESALLRDKIFASPKSKTFAMPRQHDVGWLEIAMYDPQRWFTKSICAWSTPAS